MIFKIFFLKPLLKKMIDFCFKNENIPLLTTPIYKLNKKDIHKPNVVKTLINKKNQAIYFSNMLQHSKEI